MAKSTQSSLSSSSTTNRTNKAKTRENEYQRSRNINEAFTTLQQRIPYLRPEERRQLPKIKTLRLAMQYISHLQKLVEGNSMADSLSNETRPLTLPDFRQIVTDEMRTRNSYRERAHSEEMDPDTVQRILAREQESRRRPIGIPVEMQELLPPQVRQFGPISNNMHNTRQINFNQYNVHHMTVQAPPMMMMLPYQGQIQHFQHAPQSHWSMGMENQYMANNNSNTFPYH